MAKKKSARKTTRRKTSATRPKARKKVTKKKTTAKKTTKRKVTRKKVTKKATKRKVTTKKVVKKKASTKKKPASKARKKAVKRAAKKKTARTKRATKKSVKKTTRAKTKTTRKRTATPKRKVKKAATRKTTRARKTASKRKTTRAKTPKSANIPVKKVTRPKRPRRTMQSAPPVPATPPLPEIMSSALTTGNLPRVGEVAPDFTLPDQTGHPHTLSAFHGRKVVLYFYPRDNTPGCTTEACGFRDSLGAFTDRDVAVFGISPDSVRSHDNFVNKFSLNFPLLADENHAVAEKYGVWVEKNRYGRTYMGIARTTFIIGEDGRIAHVFENVKADGHELEVLAQL